jgi:hypothetical protein
MNQTPSAHVDQAHVLTLRTPSHFTYLSFPDHRAPTYQQEKHEESST